MLRRSAVDVEEELLRPFVYDLERRFGLDVDETALGDLLALRGIAEVHRQCASDDDERLLLDRVQVPSALRPGLVAPEVRTGVFEAGWVGDVRKVPLGVSGVGRPRHPVEFFRPHHSVRHGLRV